MNYSFWSHIKIWVFIGCPSGVRQGPIHGSLAGPSWVRHGFVGGPRGFRGGSIGGPSGFRRGGGSIGGPLGVRRG